MDTVHVRLVPYSPAHLLALIEGVQQFQEQSGHQAEDGLGDFIVSDEVSPAWLSQLRACRDADPCLYGFAVVHREQFGHRQRRVQGARP